MGSVRPMPSSCASSAQPRQLYTYVCTGTVRTYRTPSSMTGKNSSSKYSSTTANPPRQGTPSSILVDQYVAHATTTSTALQGPRLDILRPESKLWILIFIFRFFAVSPAVLETDRHGRGNCFRGTSIACSLTGKLCSNLGRADDKLSVLYCRDESSAVRHLSVPHIPPPPPPPPPPSTASMQ